MKVRLQKKLLEDFPELYKQYYLPMTHTCMCWGFEVPDEWYDVIYNLSKNIQTLIKSEGKEQVEAVQVKEKFGGLRFYLNTSDEEINKLITQAEEECWGMRGEV